MKKSYTILCWLLLSIILPHNYTIQAQVTNPSTYDLQFTNPIGDLNSSSFCIDIQIKTANTASDLAIASHVIWLNYNNNAIQISRPNAAYNAQNFDNNVTCFTETGGLIFPYSTPILGVDNNTGDVNIATLIQDGQTMGAECPIISQDWLTMGTLCFEVIDANQTVDLQFANPQTFARESDDRGDHQQGRFGQYMELPYAPMASACSVDITQAEASACDPNTNLYTVTVDISYIDPAGTTLQINGEGFARNFELNGSGNETLVLTNLPADGRTGIDLNAIFLADNGCFDLAVNAFDAPQACNPNPPCLINVISAVPSVCDPNTNAYSLAVRVEYANVPANTQIRVEEGSSTNASFSGTTFTPSTTDFGASNVTINNIPSDGFQNVALTAFFTDDPSCSGTLANAYNAPEVCDGSCQLTVLSATPSTCNPDDNTYSLAVTIDYTNPASGDIQINGVNFTPDGSGTETFTINNLSSNGLIDQSVTAVFVNENSCNSILNNAYSAPEACSGRPPCVLEVVSATSTICNPDDNTYSLDVQLSFNNIPFGDIQIDGNPAFAGAIFTPDLNNNNPTITINGLPSNGAQNIDVTAYFLNDLTCADVLENAFNVPDNCNDFCTIVINEVNASSCDPATNTYSLDVDVSYNNPPAGSQIQINGILFTPNGSGQETFTINNLNSDGEQNIDVQAFFTEDITCVNTFFGAYNAPATCNENPPCIVNFLSAERTECDPADNTYTATISFTYANVPENLELSGTGIAGAVISLDGSGSQTVNVTNLPSNGIQGVDLTLTSLDAENCSSTLTNVFDAPVPCNDTCIINVLSVETSGCDPATNLFSIDVTVSYFNPINSDIVINGHQFAPNGSGEETFTIINQNSNGQASDVTAFFIDDTNCSDVAVGAYVAPEACNQDPPCTITVLRATPTECVDSTNTYSLEVLLSYANEQPGDIEISVEPFSSAILTPDGSGFEGIVISNIVSNGVQDINVNAVFLDDLGCSNTLPNAYNAPANCGGECTAAIIDVQAGTCDPATNDYTVDVTVLYSNPPSGQLQINGQNFDVDGSGQQTFTLTGLNSDGANYDVGAIFIENQGCATLRPNAYTAPDVCNANPPCELAVTSAIPSACDPVDNTYSLILDLTYENQPNGEIQLVGDDFGTVSFAPDPNVNSVELTINAIPAEGGQNLGVSASFVNESTCNATLATPYNAPDRCDGATCSVDAGTLVATTPLTVCLNLGDPVNFSASGIDFPEGGNYDFIVVSNATNQVAYFGNDTGSFQTLAAGEYCVHGVAHDGNFSLAVNNPAPTDLSGDCFEITPCTAETTLRLEECAGECFVSVVSVTANACDPATNTYTVDVEASYGNPPSSNLVINGQSFTATGTGDQNRETFTLTGLVADGIGGLAIDIAFPDDADCSNLLPRAFDAPVACGTSSDCFINFLGVSADACDPNTNTYTANIDLQYGNMPAASDLNINGERFTPDGSGNETFRVENLVADGNSVTISVFFEDDTNCFLTVADAFTAPAACTGGNINCSLSLLGVVSVGDCDPATNTYVADITVSYTDAPAGSDLNINGERLTPDGSGNETLRVTLVADGNPVELVAFFEDQPNCGFTFSDAFIAPTACGTNTCSLTFIEARQNDDCDPNTNNYTADITIRYENAPAGSDLNINGDRFTPDGSGEQIFTLTLVADGNPVDLNAFFEDDTNCSFSEVGAFTAPSACDGTGGNNCSLTFMEARQNDDCDPNTNNYTADITIRYENAPTGSDLNINGERFTLDGSGEQIFTLTLVADGNPVDLNAFFEDDTNCSFSEVGAFTAPSACDGTGGNNCSLTFMEARQNDDCDPNTNNYTADITIRYENAPAGSDLNINGERFTLDGSGEQMFTLTLVADGNPVDINAFFEDDANCSFTEAGAFTAPSACDGTGGECSLTFVEARVGDCDPNTNTYTVDITVLYENEPGFAININGESFLPALEGVTIIGGSIDNVIVFSAGEITHTLTLVADSNPVDIVAFFEDDPNCGFTEVAAFTAPAACDGTGGNNCSLTFIEARQNDDCDPNTNNYTADVTIRYENAPAASDLNINGQRFTPDGSGEQTFTLTGLASDGSLMSIVAFFEEDNSCSFNESDAYTAPTPCDGSNICSINFIEARTSDCDPNTNTYSVDVTVQYTNPPTGDIHINGRDFFVDGSGEQTFTLTDLVSDGSIMDLMIFFVDQTTCTESVTGAYIAPNSCDGTVVTPANCSLSISSAGTINCDPTAGTYDLQIFLTYSASDVTGGTELDINGETFVLDGTGQEIIRLLSLPTGGAEIVNVLAYLVNQPSCTARFDSVAIDTNCQTDCNLNANIDLTDDVCDANGQVCLTISGGVAPYNVSSTVQNYGDYQEGITQCANFPTGINVITITDNTGCSRTEFVEVVSATIEVQKDVTNATCFANGVVCLTMVGGVPPFNVTENGVEQGTTSGGANQICINDVTAGDHVFTIADSDNCTQNTIVTVKVPSEDCNDPCVGVTGGNITLSDGNTSATVCSSDGQADVLTFVHASPAPNFAFILADNAGNILAVVNGDNFDFENSTVGTCLVFGVAYSGTLVANVDDHIGNITAECWELAGNTLSITRQTPPECGTVDPCTNISGGNIVLSDNNTAIEICTDDGQSDELSFLLDGNASTEYAFVITDENQIILNVMMGNAGSFDFEGTPAGTCLIFGLAYVGTLSANIGENINLVSASECASISANNISVVRTSCNGNSPCDNIDGGNVILSNGLTSIEICTDDGQSDELSFLVNGNVNTDYAFIITDENQIILDVLMGSNPSFDFEGTPAGTCLVFGVAHVGTLSANVGESINLISATECVSISTNNISVVRTSCNVDPCANLDGGNISLSSGNTEVTICTDDGQSDALTFTTTSSSTNYVYIITDENGIILQEVNGNSNDFEGVAVGTCFVYGAAYEGNLSIPVGQDINTATADPCFSLAATIITVTRQNNCGTVNCDDIDPGAVTLDSGEDVITLCAGDGAPDVLTFTTTSTHPNYAFIVATNQGTIVAVLDGTNTYDFENEGDGLCFVYGVAYTGTLSANVGDFITTVSASECLSRSNATTRVFRETNCNLNPCAFIDGGEISFDNGETSLSVCTNDGISDVVNLNTTSTTTPDQGVYNYIITSENGTILGVVESNSHDFEGTAEGICILYGVSYTGSLSAPIGLNISELSSSQCISLSANTISITRTSCVEPPDCNGLNGGSVSLATGGVFVDVCSGDGANNVLNFITTSTDANYIFIATSSTGEILEILNGDSHDFENAGAGTCFVFGISVGDQSLLPNLVGQNINDAILDECLGVSTNSVQINRTAFPDCNDNVDCSQFTVSVNQQNDNCTGTNDVCFTPSGGEAPYNIVLNGQVQATANENETVCLNNLPSGSFLFSIVDQFDCTLTENVQIIGTNAIDVNATALNSTCTNSGSICLTITGGTPPYQVMQGTTDLGAIQGGVPGCFEGFVPNTYNFTITDNAGCTATTTQTVGGVIGALSISGEAINGGCEASGEACLTINGGNPPYQVTANGNDLGTVNNNNPCFDNLTEGSHNFVVTDQDGCSAATTVIIDVTQNEIRATINVTNESCDENDGQVCLTISGGTPPYTVLSGGLPFGSFNSGQEECVGNLSDGSYALVIADATGCDIVESAVISPATNCGGGGIPQEGCEYYDCTDANEGITICPDFCTLTNNITIQSIVVAPNGQAGIITPTCINYFPPQDFIGTDTVVVRACNDLNICEDVFVIMTVGGCGQPPVAVNDVDSVQAGQNVCVDVLDNDFDIDGDDIAITEVGTPSNGNGNANPIGDQICYIAPINFTGVVTIPYTICDNDGCSSATVTITVTGGGGPTVCNNPNNPSNLCTPANGPNLPIETLNFCVEFCDLTGASIQAAGSQNNAAVSVSATGTNCIDYIPLPGFSGSDVVEITGCVGNQCEIITLNVFVGDCGVAPCENPDNLCMSPNPPAGPFESTIFCVDFCNLNNTATITDVSSTFNCGLATEPNNCVRFTPLPGFVGLAPIEVVGCDNTGQCETIIVNITVGDCGGGQPPIAGDDVATTQEGIGVTITSLSNDRDLDGDLFTISTFSQPPNGSVTIAPNGIDFIYLPDPNFVGTDVFTYTICDIDGCDEATVTILVEGDVPCNNPDNLCVPENVPGGSINSTTVCVQFCDLIGGNIVDATSTFDCGIDILENNCIRFTPLPGQTGTAVLQITGCTPDQQDCQDILVNVQIGGDCGEAPPVATNDNVTTPINTLVNIPVLNNDQNTTGVTTTIITQAINGTVELQADGSFNYTPNAGYTGQDLFVYEICNETGCSRATVFITVVGDIPCDNPDVICVAPFPAFVTFCPNFCTLTGTINIETAHSTFDCGIQIQNDGCIEYRPLPGLLGTDTIRITGCNEAGECEIIVQEIFIGDCDNNPPVAVDDFESTTVGVPVNINVLANDSDPTGGTLTPTIITQTTNGTLVINDDGTITYTPLNGFTGVDQFTYEICNANGCSIAIVTINVTGDAPCDNPDVICVAPFPGFVTFCPNFCDLDGPITINSATSTFDCGIEIQGTCIEYRPLPGLFGLDSLEIVACNNAGICDTLWQRISIGECPEDPPIATPDFVETPVNTPVNIFVLVNDSDPNGDTLFISEFTQPTNGTVAYNSDSTGFIYTPNPNFTGVDQYEYTVCNLFGCVTTTVTINVTGTPTNLPPIANPDVATTLPDTPISIPVLNNDTEPEGEPIVITTFTQPTGGTVAYNSDSTELIYTPNPGFEGVDTFSYTICDPSGLCSTTTVTVTVGGGCDNDLDLCVVPFPSNIVFCPNFCNLDGVITIDEEDGANSTFDCGIEVLANGCIQYTPLPGLFGLDSVEVIGCNEAGLCDTLWFNIFIGTTEECPFTDELGPIAIDDSTQTPINTPINIFVLINDIDPNGDPLTITEFTQPPNGTVSFNSDSTGFIYIPNPDFTGVDQFDYVICNDFGCDTATVTINVIGTPPMNQPPIAIDDARTTTPDTPVSVPVLTNDSDPDGDPIFISTFGQAANGTVSFNSDSTELIYTPNPGFEGIDTFSYTICDTTGLCATALVTITVDDDCENDFEHCVLPFPSNLVFCPNFCNLEGTITIDEEEGANSTFDCGINVLDDGCIQYTPLPGLFGLDSVEVIGCNEFNVCDTLWFYIFIGETNECPFIDTIINLPPIAVDDFVTTEENTPVEILVLGNDSEPEGEPFIITTFSDPTNGGVVLNADSTGFIYTPNEGFVGIDSFRYQICDPQGNCDDAYVYITITRECPPVQDICTEPLIPIELCADFCNIGNGETVEIVEEIVTFNCSIEELGNLCIQYTALPGFAGLDSVLIVGCDTISGICDTSRFYIFLGCAAPIANPDAATISSGQTGIIDILANDLGLCSEDMQTTIANPPSNGSVSFDDNGQVIYTPNPGFEGTDVFTYSLCNPCGPDACDTTTVIITVTPPTADGVGAQPDIAQTPFNTPVTIEVLGNDMGNNLSVNSFTQPDNGTVNFGPDGTLIYTPNPGFEGIDYFSYLVCNENNDCAETLVSVTVLDEDAPNQPPTANNDVAVTPIGLPVTIPVLNNDSDPENGPLAVTIGEQPENGTVTVNEDGTITYTPNDGFSGVDTFTYIICDSGVPELCDTATVGIGVGMTEFPNNPPLALNDLDSTAINTPTTIDVLGNDTDPDAGDVLTVTIGADPANGSVTVSPDGTVTYTPDADFQGTDYFMYIVCDNGIVSLCDTAFATIIVGDPNSVIPIAVKDRVCTLVNTPIQVPVIANDVSPDNSLLTLEILEQPRNGEALMGTGVEEDNIGYVSAPGFIGLDTFRYRICNPNGGCDEADVCVEVVGPALANMDIGFTEENTTVALDLLANDLGGELQISQITQQPLNGTVEIIGDSLVHYTPNTDFVGTDFFFYEITDKFDNQDVAIVAIDIFPAEEPNRPPTGRDDGEEIPPGVPTEIPVLDNDFDPDGDTLFICGVLNVPDGFEVVITHDSQHLIVTSPDDFEGCATIDYIVCDDTTATALTDTASIQIGVGEAGEACLDQAPIAMDDMDTTMMETPIFIHVVANDDDPDGDNEDLTTEIMIQPTNGTAVEFAEGIIQYIPNEGFIGTDIFVYDVCDPATPQLCDRAVVTVVVLPQEIDAEPDVVYTDENEPIIICVLENDRGMNLEILDIVAPAENGFASITNAEKTLYEPNLDFTGIDYFEYVICSNGICDTTIVVVHVLPEDMENLPPLANNDVVNVPVNIPTDVPLTGNDTDPNGDTLRVTDVFDVPEGITVTINEDSTGVIITPDPDFEGCVLFNYVVCDPMNACDTAQVGVSVGDPSCLNDAPLAVDDTTSTPENTPIPIDVLGNDTDPNDDPLTATVISDPLNGMVIPQEDGTIIYVPNNGFVGEDYFIYVACDEGTIPPLCDTAYVTITVTPGPVDDVVANPDIFFTGVNMELQLPNDDLLGNDEGHPLSGPTIIQNVTNGELGFDSESGNIIYEPAPDFVGTDYFIYAICSLEEPTNCDTTLVTIIVLPDSITNLPPVAVNDMDTTPINTTISVIDVLANDFDPFGGDTLEVTTQISQAANGFANLNEDGSFMYTPNIDFVGIDSFSYAICDNGEPILCDTGLVVISVGTGVFPNDPPVAVNDTTGTDVDMPVVVDLLANDFDPNGDSLFIKFVSDPANGTTIISADQTVTYIPNEGFEGIDRFSYIIADSLALPPLCDTAVAVINVGEGQGGEQRPPADATVQVFENTPDTICIEELEALGNFTVGFAIDSLSILTNPENGSITLIAGNDSCFVYIPDNNFNGDDFVDLIVCSVPDDANQVTCDTIFVDIEVIPNNPPDVVVPVMEDTPDTICVAELEALADSLDFAFEVDSIAILTNPQNGTITFIEGNDSCFIYTPDPNFNGDDDGELIFCGTDSLEQVICDTVHIGFDVEPVPDAPTAVNDTITVMVGDSIPPICVLDNDFDVDGDSISVLGIFLSPTNGEIEAITEEGKIIYRPNDSTFVGKDQFVYIIQDASSDELQDTARVCINILTEDPFVIARDDRDSTTVNTEVEIDILENDESSGGTMTISLLDEDRPNNGTASFSNENLRMIYEPAPGFVGIDSFSYIHCINANTEMERCDTALVIVEIKAEEEEGCEFVVRPGISPNGDGSNDELFITNIDNFSNCFPNSDPPKLIIFNRWGDIVFEQEDYSNLNPWRGTFLDGNEPVPDGTYFYLLWYEDNDGNAIDQAGPIEVFR